MKKLFPWLCLVMLFISPLAACGGSQSGGPVTIRYAIWDQNQAPAMQQIIKEFEKAHPNISVNLEVTPSDDYLRSYRLLSRVKTLLTFSG